jgi:hypothetical protein
MIHEHAIVNRNDRKLAAGRSTGGLPLCDYKEPQAASSIR